MKAVCYLALAMVVQIGQVSEYTPTLREVRQGLEDINRIMPAYSVEVDFQSQTLGSPVKQDHFNQTGSLVYKADRFGRLFGKGEIDTMQTGQPMKITCLNAFDGNVAKLSTREKGISSGRINKNVLSVYRGINPRNFVDYDFFEPIQTTLIKLDAQVLRRDIVAKRDVAVVQTKPVKFDEGWEVASFYYLDIGRNFTIVKTTTCYRFGPSELWNEYCWTEVQEFVQDASGLWLPKRALREERSIPPSKSEKNFLLQRSELTFKNWIVNPELPESLFAVKFEPGTLVQDEVNGRTFQVTAIDDQMIADQTNLAQRVLKPGGAGWIVGLGGIVVVSIIAIVAWRRSKSAIGKGKSK